MTERPIRFFHQGSIQQVDHVAPTTTVLQWLRDDAHCSGTKEGCAEGDCGACTVLVAELGADGQSLELRNVNACIQFMPTLDGRALLTVEDLGSAEAPNPVQQALADCHGSQCGFCTPGFAMTLQHVYEQHQSAGTRPSRQQLADDLAGNLCRCTGYRPLLDAGERMFDAPAQTLDRAPIIDALRAMQADAPLTYSASALGGASTQTFHVPRTLQDLATLRLQLPQARLVAGATDVGLWVNKQFKDLGDVIHTGQVSALRVIEERQVLVTTPEGTRVTQRSLWIGAAATLESAWAALAQHYPPLRQLWLRFASPPVRNAGTLGGNVANGSPIGDGPPALIALDATIHLRRGHEQRQMLLSDFYLDYMKNALQPGEFVEAVSVPLPDAVGSGGTQRHLRAYKISKRYDSDISAVCAVLSLHVNAGTVIQARLVFGGMAATVQRARHAEQALIGQPWQQASVTHAAAQLPEDFRPLTDLRASAQYRLRVAQNLLQRFWLETRADAPLQESQVNVWHAVNFERSTL